MAMTECAECGKSISTSAVMCPHCGAPPEVALADKMEAPGELVDWVEHVVREALHQPDGDLDYTKVEALKREDAGVVDLGPVVTQLKRFPRLKMLSLSRNSISDVGPLAELSGLRYLFLEKTTSVIRDLCVNSSRSSRFGSTTIHFRKRTSS